jgi:hypothetical protein
MKTTYALLEDEFNERQLSGLDVDYLVPRMRMVLHPAFGRLMEIHHVEQDGRPINICRRA